MKANIHPKETETKFVCACGNVIVAKSTLGVEEQSIDTCNMCHPFYTGKQNTGSKKGQVDKFNKKYGFDKETK